MAGMTVESQDTVNLSKSVPAEQSSSLIGMNDSKSVSSLPDSESTSYSYD